MARKFKNVLSHHAMDGRGGRSSMIEHLESRCLMAIDTSSMSSATLNLYIDGARVAIPANVGVNANDTHASVFTTDTTGELFFENTNITLGNFFDTWRTNAGLAGNNPNAILSSSQIMSAVEDRDSHLQLFVNGQLSEDFASQDIDAGDSIVVVYSSNTVVSLNTNYGSIVVELFDSATPGTVANFLNYVNDGDYINSFFHRSAKLQNGEDFVIQGGGYQIESGTVPVPITTDPPILNEPGISNLRGTIAMAKLSGDPNSATSQFFVNLNDDNSFLDSPASGAFTVFGHVLDMATVDTIADLPIYEGQPPFSEVPLGPDDQLAIIQSIEGEGEISGFKFNDLDGDGVKDANELGVAGIRVWIDSDSNGVFDSGEKSTTTAADGFYEFHLDPGTYVVRAAVSSGFVATTSSQSTILEIGDLRTIFFGEAAAAANPVAVDDEYVVSANEVLEINESNGLLANDSDPQGDPLLLTLVSTAAHGAVILNADGSFIYTPEADYFGVDSFLYQLSDGIHTSDVATVTITILPFTSVDIVDLSLTSIVDNPTPTVGDSVAFTVTVGNGGPDTATNIAVANTLPAGLTFQSSTASQGTYDDGTGIWTVGDLLTREIATLTLFAKVVSAGTIISTAQVQAVDQIDADSFPGNNVATEDDQSSVSIFSTVVDAKSSLSGYVYVDANENGEFDLGERRLAGVKIALSGRNDLGKKVKHVVYTDALGHFKFKNLRPSDAEGYKLKELQPWFREDGIDTIGTAGGEVTNDKFSRIVLDAGIDGTDYNFGEGELAWPFSLVERVWKNIHNPFDANGDGDVSGHDALVVIDLIHRLGPGELLGDNGTECFPDANGDGWLTPADILCVIDAVNRKAASAAKNVVHQVGSATGGTTKITSGSSNGAAIASGLYGSATGTFSMTSGTVTVGTLSTFVMTDNATVNVTPATLVDSVLADEEDHRSRYSSNALQPSNNDWKTYLPVLDWDVAGLLGIF